MGEGVIWQRKAVQTCAAKHFWKPHESLIGLRSNKNIPLPNNRITVADILCTHAVKLNNTKDTETEQMGDAQTVLSTREQLYLAQILLFQ